MELKDLILTGKQKKPCKIVLHGPPGIGKSSFGAQAPNPIFLPTEDGLTNIDVPHFPVAKTLDDVWGYMKALIEQDHEYETFVLDTLDWLEKLIWDEVCQKAGVEAIENIGYARGYNFAMVHWNRFFRGLEVLREKNVAILLIAHTAVQSYNPPDANPYDRYVMKMHKTAAAKTEEWADAVLFANFKVFVKKDKGMGKGKASGGERTVYTQPDPAWRAKNRYGLPAEIDFNFNSLIEHLKGE